MHLTRAATTSQTPRASLSPPGPAQPAAAQTPDQGAYPNRFPKGSNVSPTGTTANTVHRRGPDHVPRGTVSLLFAAVLSDLKTREKAVRALAAALASPAHVAKTLEAMANRLEGKPVQKVEATIRRKTIFSPASEPPSPPASVAAGGCEGTVDDID